MNSANLHTAIHTAMHRPAANGGRREGGKREREPPSASHVRHHERPQHGAHAHASPGAPAAPLSGAQCGLSPRRAASVMRPGAPPPPSPPRVSEVTACAGARARGQGEFARALDAARRSHAGVHVPATALAADNDLALSLVLERDPVELGLVAAHILNRLGASIVKLQRHSNSSEGPRGKVTACSRGLCASGGADRCVLLSYSHDSSAASAGMRRECAEGRVI